MWDFLKGKKTEAPKKTHRGRGRPPKNYDNEKQKLEFNRIKIAEDAYLEQVKTDPSLKRQLIAKTFGLNLPEPDKAKEHRDKIEAAINEEAFNTIQSDPEMRKRLAERRVNEIIGESTETNNDEGDNYSEDPIQGVLRQKRDLDELEGEFGGGRGHKDSTLKDFGDILIGALNTPLGMVLAEKAKGGGMGVASQSSSGTVVLMVDGKLVRVAEGQYEQLVKDGRVLPIGQVTSVKQIETPKEVPKERTAETPITTIIEPNEKVESGEGNEEEEGGETTLMGREGVVYLPDKSPESDKIEQSGTEVASTLNETVITNALEKLKGTPLELVDFLYGEVTKGTPYSEMIWEMLLVTNYEFISNMCKSYSEHLLYGEYVKIILSSEGRKYVDDVLKLVKERDKEEQLNNTEK